MSSPRQPNRDNPRDSSRGDRDRISRQARSRTGPQRRDRRRHPLRLPLGSSARRLRTLLLLLAIVVTLCAGRLVQVQALDTEAYAAKANSRLTSEVELPAERGQLTDREGVLLATTEQAVAITADPTLTASRANEIVDVLARNLNEPDTEAYRTALTKPNTRFTVVARKVPVGQYAAIADELEQLGIYGVFRQSDPIRLYPERETAAAVLGFVNSEGVGRAGFEMAANQQLAGEPGKETYESSSGYRIPLGRNVTVPAVDGVDYQLTLDAALQEATQRRLAQGMREARATSGAAIVMNVKTGEVLAMANTPGFDPNDPGSGRPDDLFNRAANFTYEPGSTGKILTMAAALETGAIDPESRLVVPGRIASGGAVVTDYWDHGTINLTARGVLVKSSNIGMIMIGRQVPDLALRDYLVAFGIGQRSGVELPGEATGLLPSEAAFTEGVRDRATFGQAYSTTAIQMSAAIAGVVNGGVYNNPTLIKSATGPDGRPVEIERREPRRVVSAQTSRDVTSMMASMVGSDSAQTGVLRDYNAGGKTGTAQKFNTKTKKYDSFSTSFVSIAPAEDPTLLTYVVMQDGKKSGSADAAPVVVDVMEYALPRYGIVPSTRRPERPAITW